jgi:tetratricopeptide (TPR) repeat protein
MRSFSPRAFLTGASAILLAGLMVACSSDPNRERQRYLKRGNEYFALGKYPEAAVTLRNICRKDFAWGPACYRLGETYIALDQATAAAEALRNAAALLPETSPEHWEALAKLSDLYLAAAAGDKNAMEEVATYSQQLLQHDPRSFDGHRITGDLNYARAVTAYRSRRRDDWLKMLNAAIEEYRQADSIEPHQSGVGMQMARAFRAKGDSRAAASQYQAVIASAPAFVPAYREYYGLLMEEQKTLDAERLLKTAIEKNPRRIEFRIQLAEHDLAIGRRDEMRDVLARIQAEARNFDHAHLATGDLYRKLGNSDAAMVEYRAGEAQDPKNRIDYQKRERDVLLEQGRIGDANAVNREILKSNPKDENARTMSAVFVLNGGDTAKGMSQLEALVAESSDNTDARFHLGQAYFRSGDASQAQRQFTEILNRHPNDIRARLALA